MRRRRRKAFAKRRNKSKKTASETPSRVERREKLKPYGAQELGITESQQRRKTWRPLGTCSQVPGLHVELVDVVRHAAVEGGAVARAVQVRQVDENLGSLIRLAFNRAMTPRDSGPVPDATEPMRSALIIGGHESNAPIANFQMYPISMPH